jgi:hypothetical protein
MAWPGDYIIASKLLADGVCLASFLTRNFAFVNISQTRH